MIGKLLILGLALVISGSLLADLTDMSWTAITMSFSGIMLFIAAPIIDDIFR